MTTVMPSACRPLISANNSAAAVGERPAEGSSSSISRGAAISAIATASTWRWPPESVRASWARRSASSGKRANTRLHARFGGAAVHIAAHLEVRLDAERGKHVRLLRHEGDALAGDLARPEAGDRPALEADRALARLQKSRDRLEQGRLAGAVRADQHDHLALRDRDADALQHLVMRAVAGDDVGDGEHHARCPI